MLPIFSNMASIIGSRHKLIAQAHCCVLEVEDLGMSAKQQSS